MRIRRQSGQDALGHVQAQLQALERSAAQARDRVDTAAQRLGAERDKLQTFASALDDAVTSAGENLSARVDDAKAAAKAAAEGLKGEQAAIGALLESVNAAASAAAQRAAEMAKEVDREAQKLDAASEAAAARSEQVIQRHERHRAALTETLDRLKAENDHMTRTLEAQRDGLGKLIMVMSEEAKRIDGFATDGVRRIDAATATMSKRVVELASTLSAEIEKLRSQSELSSTGIDQAVQSIKAAGDSSYSSASMLGAQLTQVTETAAKATLAVDAGISRLAQLMNDLPRDVQTHAEQMRGVVEGQALAVGGLLVERLGGPSVKPYQPAGVWEEATFGQIQYVQDKGEALWRQNADIIIEPCVSQYCWDDFCNTPALLQAGEKAANEIIPALRQLIEPQPTVTAQTPQAPRQPAPLPAASTSAHAAD